MSEMLKVKSRLRDYDVHFVSNCARSIGNQKKTGAFLIIDANLPNKTKITKLFAPERVLQLKASEQNKTLNQSAILLQELVDRKVRRDNVIYAVGGGVVEDVVAFVCTILYRGVPWVFCPTTLLAQADSCIGSKSSINFGSYKNLLGAFNPPHKVLIDVNFLKTLPESQVKSGIGEILHFYLVAGKDKLASQMMAKHAQFLKNPRALQPYILESLKTKRNVIERDEFDQGERHLFNYGHTFGHAIESVTNYRVNHGQAISLGMDLANYLSWKLGHIPEEKFHSFHQILVKNLPPFVLKSKDMSKYLEALSKDKKNLNSSLGCILTRGSGKMFKAYLPMNDELKTLISSYFYDQKQ